MKFHDSDRKPNLIETDDRKDSVNKILTKHLISKAVKECT